jgi:hypothetical protein
MSRVHKVKLSQSRWKLTKPNWDTFADLVETQTNSIDLNNSNINIDEIVFLFTIRIIQAAKKKKNVLCQTIQQQKQSPLIEH